MPFVRELVAPVVSIRPGRVGAVGYGIDEVGVRVVVAVASHEQWEDEPGEHDAGAWAAHAAAHGGLRLVSFAMAWPFAISCGSHRLTWLIPCYASLVERCGPGGVGLVELCGGSKASSSKRARPAHKITPAVSDELVALLRTAGDYRRRLERVGHPFHDL